MRYQYFFFHAGHRSLTLLDCLQSFFSLAPLTPFTGSLTQFAHYLVRQLKSMSMRLHGKRDLREQSRLLSSMETRPRPSLAVSFRQFVLGFGHET